jgi:hypothetical protein
MATPRLFWVHVLHRLAAAAAEMGLSELTIGRLLGHSVPGMTGLAHISRIRAAGHRGSGLTANRDRARRRVTAEMVEPHNRMDSGIQA